MSLTINMNWDQDGERKYQTGTDRGVLYSKNPKPATTEQNYHMFGKYTPTGEGATPVGYGVPWNGLTGVSQSPEGAEANAIYADNIKYLNLLSAEEFKATITCYTYPDEFAECNGEAELGNGTTSIPGVTAGQQKRKQFGFSYRSLIGNDESGNDYGYQIHLIYNAQAAPSEVAHATVNESPEAVELSYEISTTPIAPTTAKIKPTARITIDSTKTADAAMEAIEKALYNDKYMPTPDELINLCASAASTNNNNANNQGSQNNNG